MQPVKDVGQAFTTAFGDALALFLDAIPKVIGFLIILVIGWIIAGILAKAVTGLLHGVKFNDLAAKSGFSGFVKNMGVNTDAAGVLANIVKWFVRLIVLVVAFDALGLPAVSVVLQRLLLWIPNLIVALVVLAVAGLAAKALGDLVRGATAEAGLGNPDVLANVARITVWAFAAVVALDQVGIANDLVNLLVEAVLVTLVLALGLSFGLGGRETAGEIVKGWYGQRGQVAAKLQQAGEAAQRQSQSSGGSSQQPASTAPADGNVQVFGGQSAPRQPQPQPQPSAGDQSSDKGQRPRTNETTLRFGPDKGGTDGKRS